MNTITPRKPYGKINTDWMHTPKESNSFRNELKRAINERNCFTVTTRQKLCSMLDQPSSTPLHTPESEKKTQFRRQAIEEILTSERSYIGQLEKLINFFVIPLKNLQLITPIQFNALFGQLEMIYNLNLELLGELERDLDSVAKAFLRMAPFFKLYSVYAFDYNKAQLILQELNEKNNVFRTFLQETETRPEVQTKIIALMIAPIQRIPRYRLLLQQVFLYSSPSDGDFKTIQESIKQVENTVMHMNTVIQDQEITQLLIDLQNSFVNQRPNIVKPGRKIIKQGILHKISSNGTKLKRHCVVLSDIFLYCKFIKEPTIKNMTATNSLECCCVFPLKKCRIVEIFPGNFKISCQGDGIILCCDDVQIAQHWISTIRETIDLHIQSRKTIRKDSSKRKPMRKKQLKYFDAADQVIMSPASKGKWDYENVYRFTSDSDVEDHHRNKTKNNGKCCILKPTNMFKRKRKLVSNEKIVLKEDQENNQNNRNIVDPTYGFAAFTKRANVTRNLQQQRLTNSPKDVLFPLRVNDVDKRLDAPDINLNTNVLSIDKLSDNVKLNRNKKRVTFEESSRNEVLLNDTDNFIRKNKNKTTNLSNYDQRFVKSVKNDNQLSLRQKLAQFFLNLF